MILVLVIVLSNAGVLSDLPPSPVGPDIQAFTALKETARPSLRQRVRGSDPRVAFEPRKALSFRADPLLTWGERQAAGRRWR